MCVVLLDPAFQGITNSLDTMLAVSRTQIADGRSPSPRRGGVDGRDSRSQTNRQPYDQGSEGRFPRSQPPPRADSRERERGQGHPRGGARDERDGGGNDSRHHDVVLDPIL
jgi:hypothetical protein